MKRRGIAYYIGQEARFNAAESDRWLKSGKLALPKDEGEEPKPGTHEAVCDRRPKLLDQLRESLRSRHYQR